MSAQEDFNLNDGEKQMIQNWGKMDRRITAFQKKFDMRMAKEIFGDDEGERLFLHFRLDCNDNFQKFRTYLDTNQSNILLVEIMRNMRFSP